MIKLFINSWKVKEIRAKILYTLMILAVVRLGAHVAIPGINVIGIRYLNMMQSSGTLYNIIAGGANSSWSILSMGIGPYITSSIIIQLLTVAIPKMEQLSKEGEEGRKKISSYTRYLTVVLSTIQASGLVYNYQSQGLFLPEVSMMIYVIAVISMVAGTTFIMWLAEQITEKGISNGSSMIIFVNIISNLPAGISTLSTVIKEGNGVGIGVAKVLGIVVLLIAVLVFIVYINQGERKIPVQYSSKMAGRRSFGGQSTFMPIKVNTAGVISIIFALSLLQFPETISQFVPGILNNGVVANIIAHLKMTSWSGAIIYIVLIIFFSYFYTSIVINPNEIAENMKKNGGFVPGIRPGQPTSAYISRVVNRITFVGAVVFALVAIVPIVLEWIFQVSVGFGGTTLIIVVGVCLDIVKSLESQLLMRHYKGFLND